MRVLQWAWNILSLWIILSTKLKCRQRDVCMFHREFDEEVVFKGEAMCWNVVARWTAERRGVSVRARASPEGGRVLGGGYRSGCGDNATPLACVCGLVSGAEWPVAAGLTPTRMPFLDCHRQTWVSVIDFQMSGHVSYSCSSSTHSVDGNICKSSSVLCLNVYTSVGNLYPQAVSHSAEEDTEFLVLHRKRERDNVCTAR